MLLGLAHKIGWDPRRFWAASMYEFTTALAAQVEMLSPPPAEMSDADLATFLRAQPGYRKSKRAR